MRIEFDSGKDETNTRKHGISLQLAEGIDEGRAVILVDDRKIYGETRYVAIVPLPVRLHVAVYTRLADGIRIISLRKANSREEKFYAEETADR